MAGCSAEAADPDAPDNSNVQVSPEGAAASRRCACGGTFVVRSGKSNGALNGLRASVRGAYGQMTDRFTKGSTRTVWIRHQAHISAKKPLRRRGQQGPQRGHLG
jgi:hypothetical protein